MVEAAKAHNPFAANASMANQLDITNCCPHMARLGVCLEPAMCFLIHRTSSSEVPSQMSAQAKAFNPFAAGSAGQGSSGTASKEFKPPTSQDNEQSAQLNEQSAQAGIISMLGRMGMEAQVDKELGTIYIQ